MIMFVQYQEVFSCWNGQFLNFILREGTADYNSIRSTVVEDEYDFKNFEFSEGDVVIDVGAETGGEMAVLGSLDKNLKIYSYEPLPENYTLVLEHIKRNRLDNIFPFCKAVGGKNGMVKIYYGDSKTESGRHHHFIGNAYSVPKDGYAEVEMVTLEKIFKDNNIKHCRLLKIDPEGAEYDILDQCPTEILDKIDYIIGEHHFHTRDKILQATKGLFIDLPCSWQSNTNLGHFRFKNKRVKNV